MLDYFSCHQFATGDGKPEHGSCRRGDTISIQLAEPPVAAIYDADGDYFHASRSPRKIAREKIEIPVLEHARLVGILA